jgi:hypothetical protein
MTGTDTYISEPMVGVPTAWPYSGSGVETHHNSEDTPDRVDPQSLRDLSVIDAAFLYYLAGAAKPEAMWLAELAQNRGYAQIVQAGAPLLDRIYSTPDQQRRAVLLRDALAKIDYAVDRESQAVLYVERLMSAERPGRLNTLIQGLRAFGREQAERYRQAAGVEPANPDPQAADAVHLVVKRNRFGTIPLDEISPGDREGYPSGAWATGPILALYWCDGYRSVAEVQRLTELEAGPLNMDLVGYFRFLAKHGYVTLEQR